MAQPLRIVFMGTPDFAVPSLEALRGLGAVDGRPAMVVGVFTQPDRPAGRGRKMASPPVKERALEADLPVFQPERLRRPDGIAALEALAPDLIVVAAYAQILSQRVLDLPRYGCLNVHASLLPRHRGAAPIQAAILEGDHETGVSIMQMEAGLDTGPVLTRASVPIGAAETAGTLTRTLAKIGADLLVRTIPGWIGGTVTPMPQDEAQATMTRPLRKEDGRLDWTQPAVRLARQVRAMDPWPGAFTRAGDALLKVLAATPTAVAPPGPPGTLSAGADGPLVTTGEGGLLLLRVQPAGRRPMPGADWLRGAGSAMVGSQLASMLDAP